MLFIKNILNKLLNWYANLNKEYHDQLEENAEEVIRTYVKKDL